MANCSHKNDDDSSAFAWGSENPVNAPCLKCGTAISVELAKYADLKAENKELREALGEIKNAQPDALRAASIARAALAKGTG